MAQHILDFPAMYMTYQWLVGGIKARKVCVKDYIHSTSGARILDIGCGPGYVLNYLPSDVRYTGLDLDERYVRHARQRYGHRGQFHCIEFNEDFAERHGPWELVMLNGVLHHLSDELAESILTVARQALAPGGKIVSQDGCYVPEQSWFKRWILDKDRGEYIRTPQSYIDIAVRSGLEVEPQIREDLFRVPYTAIVMQCFARAT